MPEVERRLKKLMKEGWNIFIECKCTGREFAMTYEADGSKRTGKFPLKIHAVGDTLEDLVTKLEEYVSEYPDVDGNDQERLTTLIF